MCSGGQQWWKGDVGNRWASGRRDDAGGFHLEATRRKVLTYVPSEEK